MTRPINVGIVGASPDQGWAPRAHIPAIDSIPDVALTAVATTRAETARAARDRFGARHAFTDAADLARHPDVDLVVVTVKVPAHVELVTAALNAGKHVYCEWPLTRTSAEAHALREAADAAGVRGAVGLQARFAPAVVRMRDLLGAGAIGDVLSATLYSARTRGADVDVPARSAYTFDAANGAGLVDVLGGHALDLVRYVLGPIRDLTARTALRSPDHRVAETGEPIKVTAPDQLLAIARFDSGAVMSIHLHDAESGPPRTRLEITGTDGTLALTSAPEAEPLAVQPQIGRLDLFISRSDAWEPVALDTGDVAGGLPTQALNVARLYRNLVADLRDGGHRVPDFREAAALHELLERIPRD
ncbi:Gfo/Idh/MocA family protein [Actinomadura chibensis]|uniref:Gfo/Idh/MocA family oxidoreductase n=1 Tax=Actinomadura chibensis TaxID=392828 RepID=A0A5D0NYN8_9ACTN|nr:Gfo/Idh/MocA family oxidoreductase [Actinomadura chibensis]TYB49259.1 Gfo/Idh/MocA family oxidoreductase [Actinomadura chibensis]